MLFIFLDLDLVIGPLGNFKISSSCLCLEPSSTPPLLLASDDPISTWAEVKRITRKRFLPSYYYREQHRKLQRLVQGSKTAEEYHKEMEMAMIRGNIEEDGEATTARFLNGLNKDVADVVELRRYVELEDMLNMAMKVERRLRSRSSSRAAADSSSSWNSRWPRREDKPRDKPNPMAKDSAEGELCKG